MDVQKAIELIEKSEHVAIAIPPEADFDLFASAEVIAGVLEEKGKKNRVFASRIFASGKNL